MKPQHPIANSKIPSDHPLAGVTPEQWQEAVKQREQEQQQFAQPKPATTEANEK